MSETPENTRSSEEANEIEFHYVKSNFFRVLHITGAFGGVTPQLNIHMNVFGDRPPIPKMIVQAITPENRIGSETRRDSRVGIVREVEADIVLDIDTAKALVEWLNTKISMLDKMLTGDLKEEENDEPTIN